MNKEELTKLVLDVINTMTVMSDHSPAKPSDHFEGDLWLDSLDKTDLSYELVNEINKHNVFIQESDIEEFWLDYGDKTVQQLINYLAGCLKIKD